MVIRIALAWAMLVAGAQAASACLAGPETLHNREMALIYTALKKVTLEPDDLATVKKLEAQAGRLHRAGKFEQAKDARHAALIKIGYRYEPPKAIPPGDTSTKAVVPQKQTAARGCGGDGGTWVAPNS
jgi:hypothetical protein